MNLVHIEVFENFLNGFCQGKVEESRWNLHCVLNDAKGKHRILTPPVKEGSSNRSITFGKRSCVTRTCHWIARIDMYKLKSMINELKSKDKNNDDKLHIEKKNKIRIISTICLKSKDKNAKNKFSNWLEKKQKTIRLKKK